MRVRLQRCAPGDTLVVAGLRSRVGEARLLASGEPVWGELEGSRPAQEEVRAMVERAAGLFDAGASCGAEANMAKLLAADASWEAANVALQTFGGYGVDAEYDIERKFRETRLYQVAPISTNLILAYLAEHVLDLPRSF